MSVETRADVEEAVADKWERALKLFHPDRGCADHARLTITVPRYLYRHSTLSERRAPHMLRVFVDYIGRTLELTAVICDATSTADIETVELAPMHFVNRVPLTLGVPDARKVVAMLMRHYHPETLEIRTI